MGGNLREQGPAKRPRTLLRQTYSTAPSLKQLFWKRSDFQNSGIIGKHTGHSLSFDFIWDILYIPSAKRLQIRAHLNDDFSFVTIAGFCISIPPISKLYGVKK